MPVELSRDASFVKTPCLGGDFVGLALALSHPGLAGPVAYLAGFALTPLLRGLPAGRTPLESARVDGPDAARTRARHRRLAGQSRRPGEAW